MSLESALKESLKEDLESVDDVEELNLDNLVKIPQISPFDQKFLERFRTLTHLSLNGLGLTSLANFPCITTLMFIELKDNNIKGDLEPLTTCQYLSRIDLDNNPIADLKALEPLHTLRHLTRLEIAGTPLAEQEEYRDKIFEVFLLLEVVNGVNRNGEEVDSDFDEECSAEESEEEESYSFLNNDKFGKRQGPENHDESEEDPEDESDEDSDLEPVKKV